MTTPAPSITACPHCGTRILPMNGRCPSCGRDLAAPVVPVPAPPPRIPRYRWAMGVCLALVAAGALAYPLGFAHRVEDIFWAIGVMWLGVLGVIAIALRRWQLQRRARRAPP